ncbi:transcriptional regulator [uncultured Oscillibacter sp.]|uniref:helix-turn-helix transcriptional regulator n=1 Tax=uncultured Oscillibacter sp. TaxID=876091 RepID=UPI0026244D0D|nr:helix-turn-helix transcriptional regulator [uncultured Oscillibacter sp.]
MSFHKNKRKKGGSPTENSKLELLRQVAAGIAAQFGSNCEVAIHDLSRDPDRSIVFIANGHVSGRKVGDGASNVVMEQLRTQDPEPRDHLCYLTKTPDGKILKSSTVYIRDRKGKVSAILAINYDISRLILMEEALHDLTSTGEEVPSEPERITNVSDLLDELIQQSVALVGKPAAVMNKEDKVKAIQFLSQNGAFLITKSGDKVAKYFGISKYTLYSYIDMNKQEGT